MILAALLLAIGAAGSADARADGASQPETASRTAFPRSEAVEKSLVLPTREQRAVLEKRVGAQSVPQVFQLWRARTGTHVDGYCVIDDVLGKSEPITYMLVVDPDLHVRAVEILAYRESRGGEVCQTSWRSQFAGKDPSSTLKVGTDIRNIAGATISCRAVTDGVRRELELLDVLVGREAGAVSAIPTSPTAVIPARSTSRDRTQLLMDSLLRIQVRDGEDAAAAAAIDAAFAEVARLEDVISTWREKSPASALNRNAGGEQQEVPADLTEILTTSVSFSRFTHGAFDITAGPVIDLWRNSAKLGSWPDAEQVGAVRARTGVTVIELDPLHARARLSVAGAAIDLGGIGKGYALDRAKLVLEHAGVHSALLDFGGQMLALDPPPGERAWSVDLRDPGHPERTLVSVDLVHASLSSSADYERGVEIAGRRVSHIVDPRTGMPVEGMIGTSVIRPTATEADALSTALFVMGRENGVKFAQEHGYAALFVDASGAVVVTGDFPEVVAASGTASPVDAGSGKTR